jgi:hypothetical protein
LHEAGLDFCESFVEEILKEDHYQQAVGEHPQNAGEEDYGEFLDGSHVVKTHRYLFELMLLYVLILIHH